MALLGNKFIRTQQVSRSRVVCNILAQGHLEERQVVWLHLLCQLLHHAFEWPQLGVHRNQLAEPSSLDLHRGMGATWILFGTPRSRTAQRVCLMLGEVLPVSGRKQRKLSGVQPLLLLLSLLLLQLLLLLLLLLQLLLQFLLKYELWSWVSLNFHNKLVSTGPCLGPCTDFGLTMTCNLSEKHWSSLHWIISLSFLFVFVQWSMLWRF